MAEVHWTPGPDFDDVTWTAIADQLGEAGQQLLDETASRAPGHNYAERLQTEVDEEAHRVRVFTTWGFAHFIEWGSIHNFPTAPMSSSAADLFGSQWTPQ